MKKLTIAAILLIMSRLTIAQNYIAIDPELRYQTIEGWGSSLSWWANRVGGWATTAQIDEICSWITSPNELNMNIFRYNIGGGDDPTHNHMRFDAAVPGFKTIATGSYDWTRDANQRKFLLALKAKRTDCIFEAVSYSPPYWMTNSGCTAGGVNGAENVQTTKYTAYADYLTEVVKNYNTLYGVQFRTLEPLNEPEVAWPAQGQQEGAYVNWDHQITLINACKSQIAAKGMTVQISANDANSIDNCVSALNYYGATNIASFSQINTHSYGGTQRNQLYSIAKQYGKRLWQSETGPLWVTPPDGDNSDLAYDLVIASRAVQDVHDMHTNAWLDWQLMDSYTNTWGVLRYNDSAHTYVKTKNYYVRMQFSRFIKQGYTIIESNQAGTLAAINPATNEVVVVVVNATHTDAAYKLDMNLLAGVSPAQVYRTSSTEDCSSLGSMSFTNNMISYTAPAMTVTTFVIPVTLAGSPIADGLYTIQAKHSSKYLSVQGWSSDNGAQIEQWSWVNQSNLKFNVQKTSYGYKIVPSYNNKVFSVDASSGANGALIKQWSELNAPSQRFNIIDAGSGYYKIVAHNSAKCLAIIGNGMNNGDDLVQWEWLNLDNFKWKFSTTTAAAARQVSSSYDTTTAANISIYPSPATDVLYINLGNYVPGGSTITLYNIAGKQVARQKANAGVISIPVKDKLSAGLYIVTVQNARQTISQKIVIR
ncbi:MAG TPA: RICIN domain-containing protein [Puia sp.]|nr:RICIN domain-containing protein [Puia sp.]